jgi:cellulose synthase/poly-beta-1,6-N-acetylglucosamine synthase-like glycosyltransferase
VTALQIVFWASVGLIVYAHLGYPLLLVLVSRLFGRDERVPDPAAAADAPPPRVALIVAAHDEEAVIERKVANALELDYPRESLELVVA